MKSPILAVFRPKSNDIAVFVEDGTHGHRAVALSLEEARGLHGSIGAALSLAECRAEPRRAVG